MFRLRFQGAKIKHWSSRYNYSRGEETVAELGQKARKQGYLKKSQLLEFFNWKTGGRGRSRLEKNPDSYVEEVTGISFTTKDERVQIEILTLLDGVQWPVASTILHFVFPQKYPILDFRALWSLGIEKVPSFNYQFWKKYTDYCNRIARSNDVDMRTLDRALWQYSKEHQNIDRLN